MKQPIIIKKKYFAMSVHQFQKLETHQCKSIESDVQPIILKELYTRQKKSLHLVSICGYDELFVLKLYPYKNSKVSPHFINEIRFANLNHINIITIFFYKEREDHLFQSLCSYTLMEYAPFGDFHSLLTRELEPDEKLARTYFRQLIEGLEYLHLRGIAHLDLKPKNLLIGQGYSLKITDFDLSFREGDFKTRSKGSFSFRAPELIFDENDDPKKCDIFSAGIILFVLRTVGHCPHQENILSEGHNLYELMHTDNKKFWNHHLKILSKSEGFFSEEFKTLFNKMIMLKPQDRPSLNEIKASAWYCGSVYSDIELRKIMENILKEQS